MRAIKTQALASGASSSEVLRPCAASTRTRLVTVGVVAALASLCATSAIAGPAMARGGDEHRAKFEMVRSAAAENANCLPHAAATVRITPEGPVERMRVRVKGLPPKTNFDFFVIQVPNNPFGMSWYQGDIETDEEGEGTETFIGRFNEETFIVAPGTAVAPVVHHNKFPDVNTNPPTGPVHTFHLGLWFNSPDDALMAGCPGNVTPFNGEHNAGIQVLSTRNFPDLEGPLLKVKP